MAEALSASPAAPPVPRVAGPTRFLWPSLAAPGVAWLVLLFVVPFYGVLAVAFGGVDPIFGNAVPAWNPLDWEFSSFNEILERVVSGELGTVLVRTFVYVGLALAICFLIGFPVAYYVARLAGRRRGLLLALLLAPFWISYLMRMLAWVNLLQPDGYVNDVVAALGFDRVNWLDGRPVTVILGLVYGYVPFFVLPLYAALDRLDQRVLEASHDLGMGRLATLLRVTLPLSRQGLLAAAVLTALPMTGDYYTADLLSGAPRTSMIGNQIEFYLFRGSQKASGASLVHHPLGAAARGHVLLPALGRSSLEEPRVSVDERQRAEADAGGGRTPGGGRSSWPPSRGCSSCGPSCRCSSPSSSRSTPAARAARGRGSRSAGGGRTRRARWSTTRTFAGDDATASCWPC